MDWILNKDLQGPQGAFPNALIFTEITEVIIVRQITINTVGFLHNFKVLRFSQLVGVSLVVKLEK